MNVLTFEGSQIDEFWLVRAEVGRRATVNYDSTFRGRNFQWISYAYECWCAGECKNFFCCCLCCWLLFLLPFRSLLLLVQSLILLATSWSPAIFLGVAGFITVCTELVQFPLFHMSLILLGLSLHCWLCLFSSVVLYDAMFSFFNKIVHELIQRHASKGHSNSLGSHPW